ncbi:hypothetical protein OPT61_g832 [Boeremia exigua]|uniref:Uncharacterized protein n=1 Tax=Boeremia exigua TaxID=749465 RepID=A0ACC2ISE7_9PLEO|nr:hypothetical protein OPT61_g832 [Boeremia exigua]
MQYVEDPRPNGPVLADRVPAANPPAYSFNDPIRKMPEVGNNSIEAPMPMHEAPTVPLCASPGALVENLAPSVLNPTTLPAPVTPNGPKNTVSTRASRRAVPATPAAAASRGNVPKRRKLVHNQIAINDDTTRQNLTPRHVKRNGRP